MSQHPRARWFAAGLFTVLLFTPAVHALAAPAPQDSIRRDAWTLANGLRVVTLDVSGARGVAITVVYPGGRDQDPRGNEGLAMLLGEVQFTAAAGVVPERSREELGSLRPLGYDLQVSRRYTALTEIATPEQFPGVLDQIATRMRGVTPTPAVLASAIENTRRQLNGQLLGDVAQGLYYEVRELAGRADTAAFRRLATGRGIERLTLTDLAPRLAERFAPSGAVLCVTGSLSAWPMRALVEKEFGPLPATAPAPAPAGLPFGPGAGIEPRGDIDEPVGVVGALAPALADSLHPSFYLALLVLGAQANEIWGRPAPPLTSRFQYALFDDPDLVRFYPPVDSTVSNPAAMGKTFAEGMMQFGRAIAENEALNPLRLGVSWLLGGQAPPALLHRIRTESGALRTLAWSTAVRELWGGEPFWSVYRARFEHIDTAATGYWGAQLARQELQVRLLYMPARR